MGRYSEHDDDLETCTPRFMWVLCDGHCGVDVRYVSGLHVHTAAMRGDACARPASPIRVCHQNTETTS